MKNKFKAWNKENKEMIHLGGTNQLVIDNEGWHIQKWIWDKQIKEHRFEILVNHENGELLSTVGLKDKKKSEIYEGDIYISYNEKWGKYKVVFSNGAFCGINIEDSGMFPLPLGFDIDEEKRDVAPSSFPEDMTVIGNIYENPELLK